VVLDVLTDNIPEINEEYQLHLTNLQTSGEIPQAYTTVHVNPTSPGG